MPEQVLGAKGNGVDEHIINALQLSDAEFTECLRKGVNVATVIGVLVSSLRMTEKEK